jgi:hypothetical protein
VGSHPALKITKKGALHLQIKFSSCLTIVGGPLGTPFSSTTKIGRHDIAEILLKVALSTINQIYSTFSYKIKHFSCLEKNSKDGKDI